MPLRRRHGGTRPFEAPIGGETARAFLVFGVLSLSLLGIASHLEFRDLDIHAMFRRFDAARDEARRIADAVSAIAWGQDGLDYHRLRQKRDILRGVVAERFESRPYLRYVEVRDRFGAQLLYMARETVGAPIVTFPRGAIVNVVAEPERVASVPLTRTGMAPAGEVRVGVSPEAYQQELIELRRSLRIKVYLASGAAILILITGFFYVLHLIRKNRRLEQSRLAAERRSYVGLLASGLAHEIRNPLNAMNMNLQMLDEELQMTPGLEQADYRELLESTNSEIKRLESLVNNFLAYARPAQPRFEPADLNETLRQVVKFLEADFARSRVRLDLGLEPLLPTVDLDETQFKQAVMNLLVNARQVLRSGGSVAVRTAAGSGGDVLVEVQDDGPGIPPENREKIFEVFYSNRGGGTGLGLPIARQIVERHGGTIEVDDAPGGGTVFRIRLPRRHARAEPVSGETRAAS